MTVRYTSMRVRTRRRSRTFFDMFGSINQDSTFGVILTIIPPFFTFFLILSPVVTVREIIQAKSVKNFSFAPFTCMIIATILWTAYFAFDREYMGLGINIFGLVMSVVYAFSYCFFHKDVFKLRFYFVLLIVSLITVICLCAIPYDNNIKLNILGYSATTVHLIFMSSPLVVIKHVLETKSVVAMPATFSLACFLNAVAWTAYGYLVTADIPLIISNGPSALVTLLQLSLHLIYGKYAFCKCKCNTAEEIQGKDFTEKRASEIEEPVKDEVKLA